MEDKRIRKYFKEEFRRDPALYGKMLSVFDKNRSYISCMDTQEIIVFPYFCQMWEGRPETEIEEDIICAYLWQRIIKNKITYMIQETPECFKDDLIKENKELVKSYRTACLDSGIEDADFWGGNHGEDGFVKFKKSPFFKQNNFPLEIGYVKPSQFYYHIFYRKCIARLPYNSNYIIYFEDTEEVI